MTNIQTLVVVKPNHNGKYKDDTELFCEGFHEHFGINIVYVPSSMELKDIDFDQIKHADLIWAPYEHCIPHALYIKRHIKKPVVGHYEIIPPWRVAVDSAASWGYRPQQNDEIREYYKYLVRNYELCDVKTGVDSWSMSDIMILGGREISNIFIKPYPINDELLKTTSAEEKHQIITISRLVPHKKIDHIIRALSLIKNPPKLLVVGEGPQKEMLKLLAEQLDVNIHFTGLISDEEKAKHIQESLFMVSPWSWLPVGENSLFSKPTITYFHTSTRNRLQTIPLYVEWNNHEQLSRSIEFLCNNSELRTSLGVAAYQKLINGETTIYPIKMACEKMLEIFGEAFK
jgi:glycosyltransferase involved in cell wall biosynthesis